MYALFVNSCDSYSDCWDPFFGLLERHYPDVPEPIYLNTEYRRFATSGRKVLSTCVALDCEEPVTWSRCLLRGLAAVEEEIVLYMQEDYFVDRGVDAAEVERFACMMANDPQIGHIGLTHFGSPGPFLPYEDASRLLVIKPGSRYSVCTQAGLWRKSLLESLVRPWENGWLFEILGSIRSRNVEQLLLTVDPKSVDRPENRIVSYVHTGVEKGRWNPLVRPLFETNGLQGVDFDARGFFGETESRLRKQLRTIGKLVENPRALLRSVWELVMGTEAARDSAST